MMPAPFLLGPSAKAIGLSLALLASFAAAWSWRGSIADADLAQLKAAWEAERSQISAAVATEITRRVDQHQRLQAELSEQDQKHYAELQDAKSKTEQLAADLAATQRRMYVKTTGARCPTTPLPTAPAGALVDDEAGTAQLHPETAAALARLAADADACAVMLAAWQDRARRLQGKSPSKTADIGQ